MTKPLDLTTPVDVPELASIGLTVDRAALTRGILVLGSTGSGKTASVLAPLLFGLLREREAAPLEHRSAVVVIDPKRELASPVLASCAGVHVIAAEGTPPIDAFGSIDRDRADAGVYTDHLLALAGESWEGVRDPFWRTSGREVLRDCVALDLEFAVIGGGVADGHIRRALFWRDLAQTCVNAGRLTAPEARLLQSSQLPISRYLCLLRLLAREPGAGPLPVKPSGADLVLTTLTAHLPSFAPQALWRLPELANETATSVVATAASLVGALSSARVQRAVRLDVLPAVRPTQRLSLFETIRRGEVVIYQPADSSDESAAIGRALKSAVYNAVLYGAACLPDGRPQRLAALVIDEWPVVVTAGGVADHEYLALCRGFGGATILGAQSLAAIRERLPGRSTDAVRAAITNTATRVQLATTCPDTVQELRHLVGPPPVPGPHLLDVRSPAHFLPGEAVWVAPGAWGIGRVKLCSSLPRWNAPMRQELTPLQSAQLTIEL
ncbi:type IV secretion system DNA-binding domain-containing protein [Gemmatimonas sp.]|uniref:type IV secretion system DNA-binding domain-containing protein n=1 Tax=Gemmatimonas sp. TaxID=1962908 RepID=UPI0022C5F478|nr:type IV secretion system DNA-binding domain-containing protein [Gemmatimonas sp.]MCZ8203403.1 type IV secretion system DNA-binding domain-containing protein [Gemmatimonas sp.]